MRSPSSLVFGLVAALAAPAAAEPDARCTVFRDDPGQVNSLALAESQGRLRLNYTGPMESDIGRTYPMTARLSGRTLRVVIGRRSLPGPGGVTMPAFGTNGGQVELPAGLAGSYTLIVTQGADQARYELTVSTTEVALRELRRGTLLGFPASAGPLLRGAPQQYYLICYAAPSCADGCAGVFSLPALEGLTREPPQRFLATMGVGYPHCSLRIPDAGALAALQRALDAAPRPGCAFYALRPAL